ncbi:PEP/pyruvate-binding domain-containing protein [Mycolicibacterium sp. F2034L]|uniref:PEP/pyruvate-binding domain-containing protein n=1 Tax=Mycolicibacterium sp. F2034L TaxID=2926422 RepID=UPI001FF5F125|nr:PEP/pyruvate-binding domain-containing protein [Mycolicibacterium sp. F2034L]MCK0175310.1 PEP-utilizing enzyme [Mycolicibacterium sp. F2034L]
MAPRTLEFDDITDDRFGGKAAGLAELRRIGLAVPVGFVVADASASDPLDAAVRRFTEMSAAGATPVAVRSSAAGEDGADQSFAGQYDTVLGVDSVDGFVAAVRRCAESVGSRRASSYSGDSPAVMNVVVQRMVDARAAGVVFTADPATGRRDLLVIDAVAGLGEALVDGSASPDHIVLTADGDTAVREGPGPVLSPGEITEIRSGALRAAGHWGIPLDLEWAIDQTGTLWWLQARPITTLPGDLNEMDSPLAGAEHVYTRCNIGEMMPGAFCPLTASVSGYAIDYAMQMTQVVARAQERYDTPWLQVGYFYGHMFLNMTEGTALSSGILGNSLEQFSMSICGRVIDELEPKPPKPFARKLVNTVRLSSFALSAGPAIRRLPNQIGEYAVPTGDDPRLVLRQLDTGVDLYCDVTLTHVRSSSRAAVAANILESVLVRDAVKNGRSAEDGQAEAIRLMSGAADVESALMVEELDSVVRTLAAERASAERFLAADPAQAVTELRAASGAGGAALREFLIRHGHRGYRELCMRDPSWAEDPRGLGTMLQVMLRAARNPAERGTAQGRSDAPRSRAVRLLARLAQGGARGREETKSKMALMAHALKRGYRHLGEVLTRSGRLPDADLIFFFDRSELPRLVDDRAADGDVAELVERALQRRAALPFQDALEFEDVSIGRPTPVLAPPPSATAENEIAGRPASRGTVEGVVRVAKSIRDAVDVQRGEILVAPVTDVGWTPYFTVIGALVTDIGSSVSHGAVVAREYGLPCVVNTLVATQVLRTGDRVRVDGDRGLVTRLA